MSGPAVLLGYDASGQPVYGAPNQQMQQQPMQQFVPQQQQYAPQYNQGQPQQYAQPQYAPQQPQQYMQQQQQPQYQAQQPMPNQQQFQQPSGYPQLQPVNLQPHHMSQVGQGGTSVPPPNDKLNNAQNIKYNDWIWAVLYFVQFIGVLIVGFLLLRKYKSEITQNKTTSNSGQNSNPAWSLVGIIVAIGFGIALLFLLAIKKFAKQLIWASLIASICLSAFALITAIVARSVAGIIMTAIFLCITLWYVYSVRHLIPLASEFVYLAVLSTQAFKGSYIVAIGGLIVSIIFQWLFFACASGIVLAMTQSHIDPVTGQKTYNTSPAVRGFVFFLLSISYYWTAFAVKYVVHTTICGVTATWVCQKKLSHGIWKCCSHTLIVII
jgi:uncharacterized protein YneF (UPF0154 family)